MIAAAVVLVEYTSMKKHKSDIISHVNYFTLYTYMFTFGKILLPLMSDKYISTNILRCAVSVLVVMPKDSII